MPIVRFAREGITVEIKEGKTIRDAAKRAGIDLYSHVFKLINCRGLGFCGECRVIVMEGMETLGPVQPGERTYKRPSKERHKGVFGIYEDDNERLPCQATVHADVTIWTRPRAGKPPTA